MSAPARKERARRSSVRVGLVSIVALVALVAFAVTAQNGMPDYVPGVSRTQVRAEFADTGSLRPGDDVRIANVRVGFVDDIVLVDGKPVVSLRLDGGRPVYRDASAGIGARSALGQKFIELDPGTPQAGEMPQDGLISTERTTETVELDAVLDTFDARTRSSLSTTLQSTGRGLAGRGRDLSDGLAALPDLLPGVEQISEALTTDDGADTRELLRATETLAEALDGQQAELAALTRDAATSMEVLAVDDGAALAASLRQAPPAMSAVRGALRSLKAPLARTESAARALRPGAQALGVATPQVRGLLRDAVSPLRKVPSVSREAAPAIEVLTPLLEEARPVVEQLGEALRRVQLPLVTLAPYAGELMLFFANASSALSQGDAAGRWLRFYPVINPEVYMSSVPLRNPTTQREPYPAPGTAKTHRTTRLGDQLVDELGDLR